MFFALFLFEQSLSNHVKRVNILSVLSANKENGKSCLKLTIVSDFCKSELPLHFLHSRNLDKRTFLKIKHV